MSERDGTPAAKRRRERRQRSWWKHEQLSVKMAVSAALHHSRVIGPESYDPRGCRTDRSEEEEEVREENHHGTDATSGDAARALPAVPGLQLAAFTVGFVATHDGLDDATVQFLFQQSLRARDAEEEEAKDVAEVKELAENTVTVFRLPRGTPLVMGAGTAHTGFIGTSCTSVRSGAREFPLCLC